jgi:hypothetical protein
MNTLTSHRQTSADDAVVDHLNRYRLTVSEAVQRLPAFHGRPSSKVLRTLARLKAQRRVAVSWLYAGRRYYVLREADDSDRLSETAKVRHFARLAFCCLSSTPRLGLTRTELVARVEGLALPSSPSAYYVEADRIGFLRVDVGGPGRWDRILAKALEDAREHAQDPAWRPWIDAKLFEITILTALPQKAERLYRALAVLDQSPSATIRVTALPELLYLIAPPPS